MASCKKGRRVLARIVALAAFMSDDAAMAIAPFHFNEGFHREAGGELLGDDIRRHFG